MIEGEQLAAPFLDLFATNRVGAHLPFAPATLGLTAAQAAAAPAPRFNSIWAITHHVTFWQETLLRLLQGRPAEWRDLGAPDPNGWPPAGDPANDAAWLASRNRAIAVNAQLADHVSRLEAAALDAEFPAWGNTVRRAVLGIFAHNSYHTAEIITVRHMQGWWLPET